MSKDRAAVFLRPNRRKLLLTMAILLAWAVGTSNQPLVCDHAITGVPYCIQYLGLPLLWFLSGGHVPLEITAYLTGTDVSPQPGIALSPLWLVDLTLWYVVSCALFRAVHRSKPPE